ncbi:MAG: NAD(+) synthase [Firmicutes bacterium]|nr:NAD(+) synthase [Bacillota bacterium]
MKEFKIAAACPRLTLMDPKANGKAQIDTAREAASRGAGLIVFPAASLAGMTSARISRSFMDELSMEALSYMTERSKKETLFKSCCLVTGFPFKNAVAAAYIKNGELSIIEAAQSIKALDTSECRYMLLSAGKSIYGVRALESLLAFIEKLRAEKEEEGMEGLIFMDAAPALAGSKDRRKQLLLEISKYLTGPVIYANASPGESTADGVYDGWCAAIQCGKLLEETMPFASDNLLVASALLPESEYEKVLLRNANFEKAEAAAQMGARNPWLPKEPEALDKFCGEALEIQATGLAERLIRSYGRRFIIGVSGGSDSTLALLAAAKACQKMDKPASDIIAVTMPGFGSTSRTRSNADIISEALGCTHYDISIVPAVEQHFRDIGQDPKNYDACYENSQARERTQILMDLANMHNGLVVGTGDMSELALGWCTYNGDHMSMYCANGGLTKTAVRACIAHARKQILEGSWPVATGRTDELAGALQDILDTPISPELLPPDENGQIAQVTEDKIGPYELHDFFLYHFLEGESPKEILAAAEEVFCKPNKALTVAESDFVYDSGTIKKWLKNFLKRFFSQQFKRSCMPEGPQILKYSLSPRGGLIFPSDASSSAFTAEIE